MTLQMTYGTRICITCPAVIRATPSAKRCADCKKVLLRELEKERVIKNKARGLCKCGNVRFENFSFCEKCVRRSRRRSEDPKNKAAATKYKDAMKAAAYAAYGSACKCCGESVWEFLELDHVGGWGRHHKNRTGRRVSGLQLHIWLRDNNYPPSIRLLCGSCHVSVTRDPDGRCYHERFVQDFILQNCRRV